MNSEVCTFDAAYQRALERFPGEVSEEQKDVIREDLRLHFEYPGQYVAYVDCWRLQGDVHRLFRQVLASGSSLEDVQAAANSYVGEGQVAIDYADDPKGELEEMLPD